MKPITPIDDTTKTEIERIQTQAEYDALRVEGLRKRALKLQQRNRQAGRNALNRASCTDLILRILTPIIAIFVDTYEEIDTRFQRHYNAIQRMTVRDLRETARTYRIPYYGSMRKTVLQEALIEAIRLRLLSKMPPPSILLEMKLAIQGMADKTTHGFFTLTDDIRQLATAKVIFTHSRPTLHQLGSQPHVWMQWSLEDYAVGWVTVNLLPPKKPEPDTTPSKAAWRPPRDRGWGETKEQREIRLRKRSITLLRKRTARLRASLIDMRNHTRKVLKEGSCHIRVRNDRLYGTALCHICDNRIRINSPVEIPLRTHELRTAYERVKAAGLEIKHLDGEVLWDATVRKLKAIATRLGLQGPRGGLPRTKETLIDKIHGLTRGLMDEDHQSIVEVLPAITKKERRILTRKPRKAWNCYKHDRTDCGACNRLRKRNKRKTANEVNAEEAKQLLKESRNKWRPEEMRWLVGSPEYALRVKEREAVAAEATRQELIDAAYQDNQRHSESLEEEAITV